MDQLVGLTTSEQKFVRISVSHLLEVPTEPPPSPFLVICDFLWFLVKTGQILSNEEVFLPDLFQLL